jgi:hypothetical protein
MLPPRQTSGLMLVRKPEKLVLAHEADFIRRGVQEYLRSLRNALDFIDPKDYRGISREPLEAWSHSDEDHIKRGVKTLIDLRRDEAARRKFLELNGVDRYDLSLYDHEDDHNLELIQDLSIAEELQKLVDSPEDFEIIEVARGNFGTKYKFLGFDIGYWGGDHFSIICDSAVMPKWHSPDPEYFDELSKELHSLNLNEHLLFSKPKDAENYRKYYRSQPWAEGEHPRGEFCIIQVAEVSRSG